MAIVVKYRFNPQTYENLLPQFNNGYTSYTVSDVTNHDGTITRTIESSTLPTLMRFGTTTQTPTNTAQYDALLEIYEINCSNLTDMNAMFCKCSNLKYLDLSDQDLSKVINMSYVFAECLSLKYVDLSNTNTINNGSLHSIFINCSKLKSIKLKNFRTDKVTNMVSMFNGCVSLKSLDVSSFNTENVTSMNSMFYECQSLTSLDLSSFDTKNVTSLNTMFHNCRNLTSLDLLHFNTSKVTTMTSTFVHCKSLKTLKISNWDTSKVTDFGYMFQECMALEELNIARWDTSSAINMSNMFISCSSLTSLDISRWDVSKVENMRNIFNKMSKITTLDLTRWNTESLKTMENAFASMTNLQYLDLENWNVSKVTSMIATFQNCNKLKTLKVSTWDTSSVTTVYTIFDKCEVLENVDVSKWNVSKIKNFAGMFSNCYALEKIDLTNFSTTSATNMSYMFIHCSKLKEIKVSNFTTNLVTNMEFMFCDCPVLTSLNLTSFDINEATYSEEMLNGLPNTCTVYLNQNTTSTLDTSSYSCNIVKLNGQMVAHYKFNNSIDNNLLPIFNEDFTDYTITDFNETDGTTRRIISANTLPTSIRFTTGANTSLLEVYNVNGNLTSTENMFAGCQAVAKISTDFTLKNVTSVASMFNNCVDLEFVDVSAYDTKKVTSTYACFKGCLKLLELDVSKWNLEQCSNANAMFQNCQRLETLNVSNWNVSNVTNMDGMFHGCQSLINLDVSNWDTKNLQSGLNLFRETKLTSLNLNKWNVEKIRNMDSMFRDCTELETLHISSWNTNKVRFLNHMFSGCSKLTKIDVSNFNTTQVENFAHMFDNCTSLELLDLTSFDTRKAFVAENIEGIFNNYTSDLRVFTNSNTWTIDMSSYSVNHNSVDGRLVAITVHDATSYMQYYPICDDGAQLTTYADTVMDDNIHEKIFVAPTLPTSIMFGQKWVDEQTDTDTEARTSSLLEVNFVNVNNLTTMEGMFRRNFNLTKIDFYGTTKNVTNMYATFNSTSKITSIDLSNFNTKLVTNMSNMFSYCIELKQLDVSHFNTQNVENMSTMFNYCEHIKELDLSQWNTENVTDMQKMFMDCRQLQSMDLSNFNMEKVTNITSLFHNDHSLQSVKFPVMKSSVLTHASSVFANCETLEEVDLTPLDTSSLVYTITMFNNCTKIKTINMDGMDVSKVINFNQMFSGCNSLTGLRISGWKTDSATSMENVFNGCHSIEYLDVANWNVSKVTNMSNLFRECKNLKQIDVSKWQTDSVDNISYMFHTCESLESINVSNFNVSKVTNMECMFTQCRKLKKLDLSKWNTSSVSYMNHLFSNCNNLESVDVSGFDTPSLTHTVSMFRDCTSLKVIDLTSFTTSEKLTQTDNMFTGLTSDQVVYVNANTWTLDTSTYDVNVVPVAGRLIASYKFNSNRYNNYLPKFNDDFANAYSVYDNEIPDVITVDSNTWKLGALNTETGTEIASSTNFLSDYIEIVNDVYYLFSTSVGLCFYTDNKTFISGNQGTDQVRAPENAKYVRVFRGTRPTTFTLTTSGVIIRAISSNYTPNTIYFGQPWVDTETDEASKHRVNSLMEVYTAKLDGLSSLYDTFRTNRYLTKININFGNCSNIVATNGMFEHCDRLTTVDLSNLDVSSVTTTVGMFSFTNALQDVGDLSKWDTSNVTSMATMFGGCYLPSFDFVKDWDVRNVQFISNMFNNCFGITSLDLSNWNPKSVTQLNAMFVGAKNLTTLDVSGWNTYKVTALEQTFANLVSLTDLNVDGWNTTSVTTMRRVFTNCRQLTSLDVSSFNTGKVVDMNGMFEGCLSLISLDLSNFDTSQATNLFGLFSKCGKLENVNISSFDTSNCTNMGYMFNLCESLTELDLSHFVTNKVATTHWMFRGCTSLEKLNVSTWSTNSLTDCRNMFEGCTSLTELDLSSFNVNNVTALDGMFINCSNLEVLDISNFHFGGVKQNVPNDFFFNCNKLKHISMIYCRASSFNSLKNTAFNNLKATPVNVYYHDASLSDLTPHANVTYVYYDKSTVTLPYELNKLPHGVADYIDVVNGVYVQRVGKKVFDGSADEIWSIGKYANFEANNECTIFSGQIKDKKDNHCETKMCDKWAVLNKEVTSVVNVVGICTGGNSDSLFVNVRNSTATTVAQWRAYLQSNPFTYMYELATPIYTPLTEEEKASLPLSAYSNGYIQLSSDELRPSKFEFRAKSSNRMQLDMLETGHYYLDAPTGNVKLGNVDIDVTEMPCLIKVDNASNNRLICDVIGGYKLNLHNQVGYLLPDGKVAGGTGADRTTSYLPISNQVTITFQNIENNQVARFSISYYNTNKEHIKTILDTYINENEFVITDIPSNAVYFRISMPIVQILQQNPYGVVTIYSPITLSKLPSHRIPTTFTQGMKSSVDFGYWQGSKEASAAVFRTNTSDWEIYDEMKFTGLPSLNRIETIHHQRIVEDELDISTGKHIKRVEKVILDDSLVWEKIRTTGNTNHFSVKLSKRGKEQYNTNIINTRFIYNSGWNEIESVWINEYSIIVVSISADKCNTVEQFKEWLKENPITVYYELETPEISYFTLNKNVLTTPNSSARLFLGVHDGTLRVQVKPSPLSYPTTLSPNTQYTVFHNRKNYNGSVKTPMINLGGTEVAATGTRTVVTTPSTLAHNELQFIGAENTVEQVMVVHGDWTKEGKTVDYFEGLQSSVIGDKTLENLVDEPVEIWSNKVTDSSNGGAVDYVSMDDIIAVGYSRAKLPEVQVGTNVRTYGMTLQNLASLSDITKGTGELTAGQSKIGCSYNLKNNMLKIGGQYTVICEIKVNSNTNTYIYNELFGRNSSGSGLSHGLTLCKANETGTFRKVGYISSFHPEAVTTDDMSGYVACRTEDKTQPASYDIELLSIIILEGDYTNIDIPYFEGMKSVENPVYHSVGKNLSPINTFTDTFISGIYPQINKIIARNIEIAKDKSYIVSCDTSYGTSFLGKVLLSDVPLADDIIKHNDAYMQVVNVGGKEVNWNESFSGYKYVHITTGGEQVGLTLDEVGKTITITNIQLKQGTQPTEYEPYKGSILSTPQGTVLRGVGSYKDVIGWNDGIIRRNCVEFTITGEEGYTISGITENTNTILCGIAWEHLGLENKIPTNDNVNKVICDKLPTMVGNEDTPHIRHSGGQPYSDNLMFWFDKTKFSTYTSQGINDYIKSIGGLTIIAPLADTQYEDVEITGGGNWKEFVLTGNTWWDAAGEGDTTNGFSIWTTIDDFVDANDENPLKYRMVKESELEYIDYYKTTPNSTNFITFNLEKQIVINVKGCHSIEQVKTWLNEHPITISFQSVGNKLQNTIPNTDVLIFNHGTLYTTTDTHPSTFSDFSLKTTNRYTVKDFDKLKYTVLTEQPFYLNGIDYPASPTGMTIIDVTGIADSSIYSDDTMITVVQDDGNYYADGVLTQFKGTKTFTKEFIKTSNGTYDTGMTLLEPLELNGLIDLNVYDSYNPITGVVIKNTTWFTLTQEEFNECNISLNTTSNNIGGYTFHFRCSLQSSELNCSGHEASFINNKFGATKVDVASYGSAGLDCYFNYDVSYGVMTIDDFRNLVNEDLIFVYRLKTPQIIQATPTSTYISTRPENGNIIAQDTQIQAEYLNYDNEQSIISPRMLGDGDTIRWEQGSQCYVYENDNEYIPLTNHDELFGANLQAQEYTQYAESVDGADIEVGVALKEKAVYEQTYVKYEDNIVYPETMENIDETNGVEVDYICGATWQNPNDLSDIRHLGELREDGQYDVTIRRSGDDEIRLLEGTTHISLDYDKLPPSEFELTFFNNGGVEVGKYGDTTHVLEDCVENSKLASSTIYGENLNNLHQKQKYTQYIHNAYKSNCTITEEVNNVTVTVNKDFTNSSEVGSFVLFAGDVTQELKPSTKYLIVGDIENMTYVSIRTGDSKVVACNDTTIIDSRYATITTIDSWSETDENKLRIVFTLDTKPQNKTYFAKNVMMFEYQDGMENHLPITYLEQGLHSTVVNGFSSCGKNLIYGTTQGTMEDNGLTWTWDNGIITLNGQKTINDSYLYLYDDRLNIHPMIDGHYSISYKVLSGEVDTTECRSGNNYGQFTLSDYTNTHGLQLHGDKSSYYYDNRFFYGILPDKLAGCWIRIHQGAKLNNLKIQFQLERSSVHTAFEEPKIINYTLPTPITLRKAGDVCDTFDVVSGKLTQRIGEVVLDGSEEWGTFEQGRYYLNNVLNNVNRPDKSIINFKCDKLKPITYQEEYSGTLGIVLYEKTDYDFIVRTDIQTIKEFKQWLSNNPTIVYYQLATESVKTVDLIPSTTQTTQEPTFILPQPLRSVPNGICDRLYWDENKGHYCIEKRIEEVVLDGIDENWNNNNMTGMYYIDMSDGLSLSEGLYTYATNYKATNYSGAYNGQVNMVGYGFNGSGTSKWLNFKNLETPTLDSFKAHITENPITAYYPLEAPEIIDLPHLDEKVELPTQPDIYPIGYKAVHEKTNPKIGLTIPYKVLNIPTQPVNLNFVMDIADYVLTWDDVKEARQYNIILNDEVIATVKEPQFNTGEEMYGYILVEASNEIGDNLSEELYIKTVPNAPAQLTVAHNPQTDHYDFEISFIDTSDIADYYTVMYKVDDGEWVIHTIQNSELTTGEKHLWNFSVYEIKESIEVWATATNDVGTNDILPSAIYYMSPTPQWTYRINSKDVFLRWLDESPYDTKYKLRYSYKSNGQFQYAYFEGDATEIGKLYEAVLPLAEDDEVTLALCIVSEKENLYCKPVKASKPLDPNIVPPMNFNYHWLARGLIEFYWEDQYDVDVEYEYILESMKANEVLWTQVNKIIPSEDVEGTGTIYRVEYQLEDLEQIRMKVRMKWAMNDTEWTETLTTVFIPVEGNPPTYIRRTQTAEGLLIEWEAQAYIDSYHIYVIDNETGEELQHLETSDNSILVDLDYSNSIEIAIYEISRFSGGIESDPTDPMVFTPTMFATDIDQRIYRPCAEEYPIETSTVQKGTKQPYVIHDISYTPNVETEHEVGVAISSPFQISYHPMMVDVHQAGSRDEHTINAHIKTLDVRNEDLIRVMTFERITDIYDMNFTVYTPSVASYPINLEVSKVRIVCLGDSLTSGHPFYWAETGTGDITASYPYQLSRRLKNQYEVINSGYGSDTTDRCLARFDKDVLRYQPQYCIFQCGTNDLYWAMAESLNNQEALDMKMQVVRENTMEVVKRCWDNGIIPIIGTLIPRTGATGIYKTALYEHNDWIISWCNQQSAEGREIFYVDFFNAGKDVVPPTPLEDPNNPGAMNPIYDGDRVYDEFGNLEKEGRGIHLNPEGYAIMAGAVPLAIFQTYDTGLKMYKDARCTIEDPFDDSDALNKFYTLEIENTRRNKTKTVVRYIKNIGRTQVLFAMYATDMYNMSLEFVGADGSTGQFANGLLAPDMVVRVVMNVDIDTQDYKATCNMHLASREYSQS